MIISHDRYAEHRDHFAESDRYFSDLTSGGKCLLVVEQSSASNSNVEDIIKEHGGHLESTAGQRYQETRDNVQKLTLYQEKLQADKSRVKTGEVSVHKEVITENQTIEVPVEREEVVIERRTVAQDGTAAQATDHKVSSDGYGATKEIRIPVSEEQVHVSKSTVPKEEVTVGKRTISETQHVSDDVSHEEARIESQGQAKTREKGVTPPPSKRGGKFDNSPRV